MKAPQGTGQFVGYLAEVEAVGSLAGNDVEIGNSEKSLVLPVELPDQALQPVSHHRVSDLAADGYSYPCRRPRRASVHYNKMRGMYGMPLCGKSQKLAA